MFHLLAVEIIGVEQMANNRQYIMNSVNELKNSLSTRNYKYRRNYRYYNNTPNAALETFRSTAPVGINFGREMGEEDDTTYNPQINVIASCIDTLTSKIAQSKVRPFFNTINGTFKDIQAVKQAQHFFDVLFDEEKVSEKVSEAFRDSAIYDTGVIYIDGCNIKRVYPFQVFFRPAEKAYGKLTKIYLEQKDYPATLLPETVVNKFKNKNMDYVDFGIYWDVVKQVKAYVVNGVYICEEVWDKDIVPFLFIHYKTPVSGYSSLSVVDTLMSIQQEINVITAKIKDASQLNPALTFFLPEGSNVKVTQLNNRVGNVIQYKPIPGVGAPVQSSTPAFIDSQYVQLVDDLINKAYEMVGISQLSAQSQKPTGLDAGIALSTMENIESDRFETQVNQVIRLYVDIAKACIKLFDGNGDILPSISTRSNIKWNKIVEESKNMNIQFSAADSLSKDPSTKLEQLQQLAQAGIIPTSRIAQFLQIPDIESGYSLTNNAIEAVMEVINDCLENDNFDVPEFIPFELLKEEIINTQLALKAANAKKNNDDIQKLTKLYQQIEEEAAQWQIDAEATNNVLEQEANATRTDEANSEAGAMTTNNLDVAPQEEQDNAAWINSNDFNRI